MLFVLGEYVVRNRRIWLMKTIHTEWREAKQSKQGVALQSEMENVHRSATCATLQVWVQYMKYELLIWIHDHWIRFIPDILAMY